MFRQDWSDEKNLEVFGKCSNPNWHGHNYILFVTVKGGADPKTGLVIHLRHVSKLIDDKILKKVDHKNLNIEVDFLKGKVPTSENVAVGITVVVDPLNVIAAPLKVYAPVEAVKVVALFVKLPLKVGVLATVSFHTAPLLSVTSPVNTSARTVVCRFTVPVIFVAPSIVRTREQLNIPVLLIVNAPKVTLAAVAVSMAPLLIVTDPAAV